MIDGRYVENLDHGRIIKFGSYGMFHCCLYTRYITKDMPLNDFKKLLRVMRQILIYDELIIEALDLLDTAFNENITGTKTQLKRYAYLMKIRKEYNNGF